MNFRKLDESALANFTRNIATLLEGSELPSLNSSLRADLVAAIGTLPDTLGTQALEVLMAEGMRKAAVSARNDTRQQIINILVQIRNSLKASVAPKEHFDICGYDFPQTPSAVYTPNKPSDLAVVGFSDGTNVGRFNGNNNGAKVHFQIWRREGKTAPWTFEGQTMKQRFVDLPVVPGKYYEYRVRAVAAQAISNYSNTAVVYGT